MPANLHVNVPPPPWKEGVLPGRMKGHRPRYARIDQGDTAMSQSTCECGWSGAAGDTASGQRRWHRMHRERLLRLWRGETFPAPNLNLVKQQAGSPPAPTSQEDRAHLAWLIARAMPSHEVIQAAELPAQGLYHLDVYVPDLALAVAYLGAEQCAGESQQQVRFDASGEFVYFPDDAALSERRRTLEEMRRNCEDANVTLIEWRHDFPITEANVRERLS